MIFPADSFEREMWASLEMLLKVPDTRRRQKAFVHLPLGLQAQIRIYIVLFDHKFTIQDIK